MSDPQESVKEPAFKPGDKVIVVATVVKDAGQNWILKLSNSAFQTFTPDQFTKQP